MPTKKKKTVRKPTARQIAIALGACEDEALDLSLNSTDLPAVWRSLPRWKQEWYYNAAMAKKYFTLQQMKLIRAIITDCKPPTWKATYKASAKLGFSTLSAAIDTLFVPAPVDIEEFLTPTGLPMLPIPQALYKKALAAPRISNAAIQKDYWTVNDRLYEWHEKNNSL